MPRAAASDSHAKLARVWARQSSGGSLACGHLAGHTQCDIQCGLSANVDTADRATVGRARQRHACTRTRWHRHGGVLQSMQPCTTPRMHANLIASVAEREQRRCASALRFTLRAPQPSDVSQREVEGQCSRVRACVCVCACHCVCVASMETHPVVHAVDTIQLDVEERHQHHHRHHRRHPVAPTPA
jgi:hypothetical protein